MRLKRYKKKKISIYFSRGVIIIILSLILSIVIIDYFSKRANYYLLPLAESKVKSIITILINDATNNVIFNNDLFTINKNNDGVIEFINYNSYEANKLMNVVTLRIEDKFNEIYNGKYDDNVNAYIVDEVPFGVIFNNTFLNGLGPKIKIKSKIVGSIVSNIETEVKPYGINNTYLETRIFLEVTARIYMPFITEEIKINNVIPISMNIVQGSVPNGYITSYK